MKKTTTATATATVMVHGCDCDSDDGNIPEPLHRCHSEFGTPTLRHPRSKYPSVFGTGGSNSLGDYGTPTCTPQVILHPL